MKCLIVDDEEHVLELMSSHVEKTPDLELVLATTNPVQAIQLINKGGIDLVYLDVQMPDMTGLELMNATRGKTRFIMCTAYKEYAYDGFEYEVIDFLLKPVNYARFVRATQKAKDQFLPATGIVEEPGQQWIIIRGNAKHELRKIAMEDINYIEASRNYVQVHTANGKFLSLQSMKKILETLPPGKFIRVHHSFIIPLGKIHALRPDGILLSDNKTLLPVSATYKTALLEELKGGG
jgi:two-component system, LytTR family, response regulator